MIRRLLEDCPDGLLDPAWKDRPEVRDQILTAFRPCLLSLARAAIPANLKSKLDPVDLVQNAYAACLPKLTKFRGTTYRKLFCWLRAILRCTAINTLVHLKRKPENALGEADRYEDYRFPLRDLPLLPDETAMHLEMVELLLRAISDLPEPYRNVVILRHCEHQSFLDIAHQLDCTEVAVRKRWQRALGALREAPVLAAFV